MFLSISRGPVVPEEPDEEPLAYGLSELTILLSTRWELRMSELCRADGI
jgi:hypothetical protein